jgi:hypothetical protein
MKGGRTRAVQGSDPRAGGCSRTVTRAAKRRGARLTLSPRFGKQDIG